MSNYTKTTDFTAKDGLTTGNPAKLIKGADFDVEFNAIATAVSSKIDTSVAQPQIDAKAPSVDPTFTGTVTMTGATAVNVPAPTSGTNAATKTYVDTTAINVNVGSWFLIKELPATTATVDFVNGSGGVVLDATYDEYIITLDSVLGSTYQSVLMATSTNGGSTYDSGSTDYVSLGGSLTGSIGVSPSSSYPQFGFVHFFSPSVAQRFAVKCVTWAYSDFSFAQAIEQNRPYVRVALADVDAIRFYPNTGNFVSGKFKLFGRRK